MDLDSQLEQISNKERLRNLSFLKELRYRLKNIIQKQNKIFRSPPEDPHVGGTRSGPSSFVLDPKEFCGKT